MNFIQALALVRKLRGNKKLGVVWYAEVGRTSTYVVYAENATTRRKYISSEFFIFQRVSPAMAIGY